MDLTDLKPKSDLAVIELKHPMDKTPLVDADGKPFTITILLRHTKEYRDLDYEMADRRAARMAKAKKSDEVMKTKDLMSDINEITEKSVKGYYLVENGQPVDFTPENTKRILEDYHWIKEQVLEEQQAYENFTKV